MSNYNRYSDMVGSNPYEQHQQQQGGYGSSNPYASDGGNPYGGGYGQTVRRRSEFSATAAQCAY